MNHANIVRRGTLVGLLLFMPVACKSSRAATVATTAPAATTDTATTSTTLTTTTTLTPSTTTTSTTTPPPTTTTEPLVVEGGIVKVANASGVDGAAGQVTDALAALGFTMSGPTNAAGIDEDLAASKIYVIAGSEGVAESVSKLMGGIPVSRMPTPAWIKGGTAGLADATVLVMLGHDLAGTPLADMRH